MYKGLQHPTFVYSESSDVTEVYVTKASSKRKSARSGKKSSQSWLEANSGFHSHQEERSPCSSSSRTSFLRPSSTFICSLSNHRAPKSASSGENDCVQCGDKEKHHFQSNDASRRTQLKILRELSAAKRARDKRTEEDFLLFAKEFAKKCRMRPSDNLLNPVQYDDYHRSLSFQEKKDTGFKSSLKQESVSSTFSFIHSSSLIGLSAEESSDVGGHVVGDLQSFLANTSKYFDNPDLSDIILVVGDHRFYAHKFALAAQSDVFHDMMLASNRCTSCPEFQKELELNDSKECQEVFSSFLRFFYCGKITFTPETALPLLVLSAKYRVESLRAACDTFITEMIEDGDLKSAIRWLRYASVYQLYDLTAKCVDGAIADNVDELVETDDWLTLSADCVEAVLRSSSLLVPHEFFLFEALQRWFINKRKTSSDEELMDGLRKTLPQIRFSQMQGNQLLSVEESSIGIQFKSIVRGFLSDAYRYQILSKDCPEFQEAQYLPRDYTNKERCVQFFYNPSRNKRILPSIYYGNGRWEIQPRRYYDTLNVVIILKKPLENDIKVYISILIYKRNGSIHMRLRRKACVLRACDTSPRPAALSGGLSSTSTTPGNSPRSNSSSSNEPVKQKSPINTLNTHRPPHGAANKLHGPNNGQEYYAIDNIISDGDFQVAMSNAVASGLKLGVIIRTWSANIPC